MMRRRREPQFWESVMSREELRALADFNGERSRGLLHSPEYAARMAALQGKFHEAREAEARRNGWIVLGAPEAGIGSPCACAPRCPSDATRTEYSPYMDDYCHDCTMHRCDAAGFHQEPSRTISERYFDTLLSVTDDPAEKARIEELRASRETGGRRDVGVSAVRGRVHQPHPPKNPPEGRAPRLPYAVPRVAEQPRTEETPPSRQAFPCRRLAREAVVSLVGFKAQNHPQQATKAEVDDRAITDADFAPLHARFRFTIDAAASSTNAKLPRYWTREDDALSQSWRGERVWCNPPYSNIRPWVEKAWREVDEGRGSCRVVMLLPNNRCEQAWWQGLVEPFRDDPRFHVEFLPGRMRFVRPNAVIGPKGDRPPFGCCLLIWGDA